MTVIRVHDIMLSVQIVDQNVTSNSIVVEWQMDHGKSYESMVRWRPKPIDNIIFGNNKNSEEDMLEAFPEYVWKSQRLSPKYSKYEITGLLPETVYQVEVSALRMDKETEGSELKTTGTVLKEYVTRAAKLRPETPNALQATKLTSDELRLSWSQPSSNPKSPTVDKWRVYVQKLGPSHVRVVDSLLEELAHNFHSSKPENSLEGVFSRPELSRIDFPRVVATTVREPEIIIPSLEAATTYHITIESVADNVYSEPIWDVFTTKILSLSNVRYRIQRKTINLSWHLPNFSISGFLIRLYQGKRDTGGRVRWDYQPTKVWKTSEHMTGQEMKDLNLDFDREHLISVQAESHQDNSAIPVNLKIPFTVDPIYIPTIDRSTVSAEVRLGSPDLYQMYVDLVSTSIQFRSWKFEVMMPDESLIFSDSTPFKAFNSSRNQVFEFPTRNVQKLRPDLGYFVRIWAEEASGMILVAQGRIPKFVKEIENFRPTPLSSDGIFLEWDYEAEGSLPEEMTIAYMDKSSNLINIQCVQKFEAGSKFCYFWTFSE